MSTNHIHIQRALTHQVAFDFETEGHIPGTHEAPDYSLVTLGDGNFVIHQCSFLYEGPAFSLHDPKAQLSQSPSELAEATSQIISTVTAVAPTRFPKSPSP